MSIAFRESAGSDSSHEIVVVAEPRYLEIDQKHLLVSEFLESHGYDALILQDPANFAWFTAGGDNTRDGHGDVCGTLFITPDARVILANNVDSGWLFETQVKQLGFQLKERPWQEPLERLPEDLCRGRNVVSDTGLVGTKNVSEELSLMRLPLSLGEQLRARELAADLTSVVERAIRKSRPGLTELDVAGTVLHRLTRRQIRAVGLQVSADRSRARHACAHSSGAVISKVCSIAATGMRAGICAAVRRTVCFGPPEEDFQRAYSAAALVQATGIGFSRAEWEVDELWSRVRRIYEKFGYQHEWRRSEQCEVIAHRPREIRVVPRSPFRLSAGTMLHWHPLVGAAGMGDTILVSSDKPEILTRSDDWPEIEIALKGEKILRPALLIRDPG